MKHQTSTCQLNSRVLLNNIKNKPKGHNQNKNTTSYFSMQQTWTSVSSSVKNSLSLLWAHRTIGLNTAAILNTPLPATCRIIARGDVCWPTGWFSVEREVERETAGTAKRSKTEQNSVDINIIHCHGSNYYYSIT